MNIKNKYYFLSIKEIKNLNFSTIIKKKKKKKLKYKLKHKI